MITRRERLVKMLSEPGANITIQEIADELKISAKTVIEDLGKVRKTIRSDDRHIEVRPASCLRCEFVFTRRTRISDPSKCPKCRSESIKSQGFRISSV